MAISVHVEVGLSPGDHGNEGAEDEEQKAVNA